MRTLKKYKADDDFDLPKQRDHTRDTAVLIRQSDYRAAEDHSFNRESQLHLVAYAQRLHNRREKAPGHSYGGGERRSLCRTRSPRR